MKIIVADDEILQLNKLERSVGKVIPEAEISAFSEPLKLMEWIDSGESRDADVAFLDIEMGAVSGIKIAKALQSVNPQINIVFVTGFSFSFLSISSPSSPGSIMSSIISCGSSLSPPSAAKSSFPSLKPHASNPEVLRV